MFWLHLNLNKSISDVREVIDKVVCDVSKSSMHDIPRNCLIFSSECRLLVVSAAQFKDVRASSSLCSGYCLSITNQVQKTRSGGNTYTAILEL